MARHDVVSLHHDGLRTEADPSDLDAEAGRLAAASIDPGVAAAAGWFRDRAAERGDAVAAARFDRILAGVPAVLDVPAVVPVVEISPTGEVDGLRPCRPPTIGSPDCWANWLGTASPGS